jgi:hypothetical protein
MLAPNEVLYANFICRYIHFVHHVVEFLLITSGSRCFPVNSPPVRGYVKLACGFCCKEEHLSFLFEQAVFKPISLAQTSVVMALVLCMDTNTSVYVSVG